MVTHGVKKKKWKEGMRKTIRMKQGGERRRGNLEELTNRVKMVKIIALPQNRFTEQKE